MSDSSQLVSLQRSETKLIAHTPFLELLRDQGRERATAWLGAHQGDIGRCATVDLKQCFS